MQFLMSMRPGLKERGSFCEEKRVCLEDLPIKCKCLNILSHGFELIFGGIEAKDVN
jgi:hypothetical protein